MKVFSPFGQKNFDEYEEMEATQSGADRACLGLGISEKRKSILPISE
jgi:hypothetical protein